MSQTLEDVIMQSSDKAPDSSGSIDIAMMMGAISEKGTGFIGNLYDVAMGANKTHYLGDFNGKNISLRLLTTYERNVICVLVPIKIVENKFSDLSDQLKSFYIDWYSKILQIIISSTSRPSLLQHHTVYKQFALLHADASIKFRDLELLSTTAFANIYTQLEQLETRCNPTLDRLSSKDIEELLSQIKKQQIRPSDLNWNTCYQLLDHLTKTDAPTANLSSTT